MSRVLYTGTNCTKQLSDNKLLYTGANYAKQLESNNIFLLGIPFEGAISYRSGASHAPDEIRKESHQMEEYSPYLHTDLKDLNIQDLGNLKFATEYLISSGTPSIIKNFQTLTEKIRLREDNIKLVTIGGDHSVSYAPIYKYLNAFPDLCILQLDAHADLRHEYLNDTQNHACIMRRVLDLFGPRHRLLQSGIRSGTKEEFDWMADNHTLVEKNYLLGCLESIDKDTPIYLTLDIDYFDPSFCPGTGTPETGGPSFLDFIEILKVLKRKNLVGADLVELAPDIDPTGNSTCFASKVLREILCAIGKSSAYSY